ncbi:sigma 54-interacting transcriptional regulator [uncultured Phocaeicola sp.]|uniref:sigma-54-dependent transcriptional regulator n=1 Tax=uncultured Phocaeicola sp. TaxID=990718 RepID=UPI00258DDB0D|nr:sigma 54-interacting transcriptional regulator [uncultured Phocaeicola sp.]
MNKILIVDASASDSRVMSSLLSRAGYDPVCAESIEAGKQEAVELPPGAVIVTALRLYDGTARELIDWLKTEGYKFPVIVVMDLLNPADLLEVMSGGGAVDVIQRPAIDKQLVETVGKYARPEHIVLTLDNQLIPRISEAWKKVEARIDAIAATNANAIIFGECGTGKEQIARQIYQRSSREQKPITVVESGSAAFIGVHSPSSDRSEMYNRIKSYFSKSAGGTIIIKNVHLLSIDKQSVLMHILENEHPDVRVICTAEPELLKMVANKSFRPNLFFILRQSDIAVPALKDDTEDIPVIADYFLKRYAAKTGKQRKRLDASAVKALKLYPWPGNLRELKDVVLFAAFHAKDETISAEDINFNLSEPETVDELNRKNPRQEKENIIKAYQRADSWTGAAKLLGISERALLELRKKLGIDKNGQPLP